LQSDPAMSVKTVTWRTPAVILVCGCAIAVIGFGARSGLGFFMTPISSAHGWGRDVFALALAFQMLLWGAGQPFAGALADRFGAPPVLAIGAVVYALGLGLMAYASSPLELHVTAGAMIGLGMSGASFTLVIGSFGKLMPPKWRSLAFGAGTAAGSFGQFLFSPLSVALIGTIGWQTALVVLGAIVLLIIPLAPALAAPRRAVQAEPDPMASQSVAQALREAFGHRSYVLLMLGYFTCGFQLFFIGIHLPAYLIDRGLPAEVGGWTLAIVGLFNIIGSVGSGWLGNLMPRRFILASIYFLRSVAIFVYIMLPLSTVSTLIFGAVMGLIWLSTVPPTSSLVAIMFGTRWLTMLVGAAFFSHQIGGFLGVWLGGLLFERTGSYDVVWWLTIFFGIASALINLPIVEKPVVRTVAAPA
jgi:MFS family permease